jgi:leucyl/phenylalanyl-tRNA---protein transferase
MITGMPVYLLSDQIAFPPAELADESGLLAVGGGLEPERLLLAYASGIFPWYSEGQPILWHAPDPRMVLLSSELHVNRSLRKTLAKTELQVTLDTAFVEVVQRCAEAERPEQDGTWITDEMLSAYARLHELGFAHSCETWRDGQLVGGLYGVSIGDVFFGESMFAAESDASKIAFVRLIRELQSWGVELIDCQVHTEHLERFGAREWSRARFQEALGNALQRPTRTGPWRFEDASQ